MRSKPQASLFWTALYVYEINCSQSGNVISIAHSMVLALTFPPPVRATARYTLLPLAESLRQTPSTCSQLRSAKIHPRSNVSIVGGLLTSWDPKKGGRRNANECPGSGTAKTKRRLARGTFLSENKRFSYRARTSTKRAKDCLPPRDSRENVYRGAFPPETKKKALDATTKKDYHLAPSSFPEREPLTATATSLAPSAQGSTFHAKL